MPARIEDVAAHAGVSTKTVSRVLNGHPSVRATLRTRIEASIRALNYVPNPAARGLAGNRSYLVALLYDNPTASSSYIMELIVGVLQACTGTAYNAVLHPFDASDDLAARIDGFVATHRPEALVLVPPHANNTKLLQRLDELDIRYATVSSKLRQSRIDIGFDERKAAADIVEHLISLGHRRIAHVTGLKGHGAYTWRLSGYRDALRKAGIAYDESLVVEGDFTFASGVAGGRELLSRRRPPTAIFAANDDVACGVIREAYERGLAVPDDLSVCGFDDTPVSQLISPGLTTVRQPCREIACLAVESVLRSIRDPALRQQARVPYQMQLRASTARPKKP
ncbi:LacI family DNA-binding transcriptional regulator [Dyella mobilis]|uniref:LacI family DNA-binding transcriptional regulator n=1 Tax=Dyella mobilis TaxID=1849582 RepID=A0ABS2KC91_9GAMM|nr:LacI family DNA-binding transcriptional regulator [Dyella mobilis]MBM7128801.1 LacI family DNA-binding transcriptional regulator [Dyella mobilis]GLQ99133.1 LacI family transcriptional regulator [Dyella mobilis]